MIIRAIRYLAIIVLFTAGHVSYAQEGTVSDEQIKAVADAADEEEHNKENAPWHFLLSVKNSHLGVGHAGNKADIEGTMEQVYKSPTSQSSVKSKTLDFSFYCGNTMPDAPVDPCKPYLKSSHLEIWGRFTLGSDGEPSPNSLIVLGIEPQ